MALPRKGPDGLAIKPFKTQDAWLAWLDGKHASEKGIWIRYYKKATGKPTIDYQSTLDVALCYGWIDGQGKGEGAETHIQRWVPRAKRSMWSKRNVARALELIEEGRMQPAGLAEIERAKADGRWDAAYDAPSTAKPSPELEAALKKNKKAAAAFAKLDSRNRFAILNRIQTAKRDETKTKRIKEFVAMLARGEKVYP
ncbi:MAG: YdeI/OmpD-associated family protein [Actinomycetota bacterium]